MPSKSAIAVTAFASLVWLIVVSTLAIRFNVPSSDGIMYSLPFAAAHGPLEFDIPFLDNFDGYGRAWGHHWPGAMWVKAVIFQFVPYSRGADVVILSLFQLLTAITAAGIVWRATCKLWPAALTLVIVLSDRLLLLTCAGNRFETIPVAVVILLIAGFQCRPGTRNATWRWLMASLAFLSPTLHPYSLALGGIIVGSEFLVARRNNSPTQLRDTALPVAFILGCAILTGWFVLQPEALKQFSNNLDLQKSFYQSWNSVIGGLTNYRLGGGLALWGAGIIASGLWIAGYPKLNTSCHGPLSSEWRFLIPILFLTVILIHTLTRCENFHYLTFGSPLAAIMICIYTGTAMTSSRRPIRWLPAAGVAGIAALHAILLPYRVLQFRNAGMPDLDAEYSAILNAIPAEKTVFIPHPMWPAAITDKRHQIRWFTLPIASRRELRKAYEKTAYADAKPGDMLIVDHGGTGQTDRFGLYPTFSITPPDPALWTPTENHKHLFEGSMPWGIDLSIYTFSPTRAETSSCPMFFYSPTTNHK